MVDASVFLYRRLERQKVVRGFGCVENEYPDVAAEVTPSKLEATTGLPLSALTPKQRGNYWRLAGISLCLAEYALGTSIGIDPLFTLIPATFFLFGVDQLVYKGAFFESFYRLLVPSYRKKIICHEAGHFLISYLLGVPVRGCVTSAWEARNYPEIRGQAGTIFYDTKLADELASQKVTRSSLDRLSVITMAGIAAEAAMFGVCEGGATDEQALVQFLTSIQPPWNILRIQGQARWAVLQAILLIREHRESYDALVKVLEEGKGIGDAVLAIEQNLPSTLPSALRQEGKRDLLKKQEEDTLMKFIQRMTWKVGGVSDEMSVSEREEVIATEENSSVLSDRRKTLENFSNKLEYLEKAVVSGDLNVSEVSKDGGLWLNGLQSLNDAINVDDSIPDSVVSDQLLRQVVAPVKEPMPEPKEGFEERLVAMATEAVDSSVDIFAEVIPNPSTNSNMKNKSGLPTDLLKSNKGYQMKLLELEEASQQKKV